MSISPESIISFWFTEITPKQWWVKDPEFDTLICSRFKALHQEVAMGNLSSWRQTPLGALAEIIVLDQFSRNMFRDTPQSFQFDGLALLLSLQAVERGDDQFLEPIQRSFLYMPMMHSELLEVHEQVVKLYEANGLIENLEFEKKHKVIIDRFGRYPHRNAILGRESTAEELAFLKEPGSSF